MKKYLKGQFRFSSSVTMNYIIRLHLYHKYRVINVTMNRNKNKSKIPAEFKRYFWDIDFNKLDLKKQRNFILERLLNYGVLNTFGWIFHTFSNREVEIWLNKKGKYSLSRYSYLFWKKIAKEKEFWKNS